MLLQPVSLFSALQMEWIKALTEEPLFEGLGY